MAPPILSEGPYANNRLHAVIHRFSPHETCVFHSIHNFWTYSQGHREKRCETFHGCPAAPGIRMRR